MDKALEGINVISCSQVHAGTYCVKILAELGANVTKIERPKVGELTRNFPALMLKGESYYIIHESAQNRFITLNLRHPKGKDIFIEMIKKSDIFFNNLRPGVMKKFGLDYEDLKKIKPDIIYATISMYGYRGDLGMFPGFGALAQARSGLMVANGWPDKPPVLVGVELCDHHAGILTALSILAALRYRDKTGKGQRIDISLFDAGVDLIWEQCALYFKGDREGAIGRFGNNYIYGKGLDPRGPEYKVKDGYIWAPIRGEVINNVLKLVGREDLIGTISTDRRNRREADAKIRPIIEELVKTKTREEAVATLREMGAVYATPIQNVEEMLNDPQTKASKLFVEVDHPTIGKVKVGITPLQLSETPVRIEWPGMPLGYHNEEVYSELGYSNEEVAKLRDEGVI